MPDMEKAPDIVDTTATKTDEPQVREVTTRPVTALVKTPDANHVTAAKSSIRFSYWIVGALLAAAAGLAIYFQPWASKATEVAVETVTMAPVTRVLAVNGRIAASHSVDLRPLVNGTLTAVLVAEGDVVVAEEDLARIDATAQQASVRQAVASLDTALVALEETRMTYDRLQALGEFAARTALEEAARAVQSAEQEVARSTALVDQAQIQLDHFTIRAPMTGSVLELNIDPGQSIDTSTVLMTIADLSRLEVETDVDEAYATQIQIGQPVVLQLAGETTSRTGRVSFVSQRVDAATGGLAVRLSFDAPLSAPVALTVTANIIVDSRSAAISLPRAAIVTDAQGTAAFVVEDGTAHRQSIDVIDWPAARLIVTDGLRLGDVVIADATGLTDGETVTPVLP